MKKIKGPKTLHFFHFFHFFHFTISPRALRALRPAGLALLRKMSKKWQKKVPNRAPSPAKSDILHDFFFFTQKGHPPSQKTEFLHEKMTKKWLKNWPKKADTSAKMLKFCMKNLKSSYLWGFWKKKKKKKFQPPTSPNF